MAERLIRESDVIENIDEWLDGVGVAYVAKGFSYYAELKGCIADAPTVEAKPVVHAHWEYIGVSNGKKIYKCTNCKAHIHGTGNFCKECGAQMDEKESD